MIRYLLSCVAATMFVSAGTIPHQAQAGFEFMPPKKTSAPMPSVQNPRWKAPQPVAPVMAPPVISPAPLNTAPLAVPPPPVVQQPLAPMVSATPIQRQRQIVPAPAMKPIAQRTGGVVINPYPLRSGQTTRVNPSNQAVGASMAESGGALTPVQLGAGMNTGVKPYQMAQQASQAPRPPQMIAPNNRAMSSSLTPIPGGEPAPLPNVDVDIEQAYRNPAVTQTKPMIFANAVGFASDIPLSIALEQVVPKKFQTQINAGVSVDALMVSWEGGQPWNVVLNQMLRPYNLTANIQGQNVVIQPMARL